MVETSDSYPGLDRRRMRKSASACLKVPDLVLILKYLCLPF